MGRVPNAPSPALTHPYARARRTVSSLLAIFALALLTVLGGGSPASAHTQLEKMFPADGSTVASAPSEVVLTFSEAVSSSFVAIQVTGPRGESVSEGRARVDGAVVTQALASPLAPGKYTVAYRVVSSDGHPVSDATTFTVVPSTPSSTANTAPLPSATTNISPSSVATMGQPTNIFDSSHIPGFVVVGLLVLGGLLLLLWERRRGRH